MKEKYVDIDPALNALFLSNVWSICTCNAAFIKTSFFKMIAAQKKLLRKSAFFSIDSSYSCFSDALIFRKSKQVFSALFLLELLQI